jgi:hypothetical protein
VRASAAIALLVLSSVAGAAELGTLFHTPKEREQLERLRKGEKMPDGQAAIERPDPVITGYVKRSDGKSTVFIDKQPVPVRNPRLERRLEPKVVERYEPLPMPVAQTPEDEAKPIGTGAKTADAKTLDAKPADSKSPQAAPGADKATGPRRRPERDE